MVAQTKIDQILRRSGEMGRRIREKDWARTELGHIRTWPQSLVTAMGICLTSRFPIQLWWGPKLVIAYNDAYIPIAGAKHPELLGQPGSEAFTEVWDIIGPMFQQVMSGGEATWSEDQLLFLNRNGYLEESYFTWSYSPIQAEDGGIAGIFSAVQETTKRVLGERRMKTLRELGNETANARSVEDVSTIAAEVLARNSHDIPFSAIYLVDPAHRDRLHRVGSSGIAPESTLCPQEITLGASDGAAAGLWPLARALAEGDLISVDGLDQQPEALPGGPFPERAKQAVCLPIPSSDQSHPAGVLLVGISPRRAFDDDYRGFLDLASGQISIAIQTARSYQEERTRAEALAELDRAKTAFFSNVSHEFRTPLTLMLGPVEDLLADQEEPLRPRQHAALDLVHRNTLRLLKLVNNLLDFSRIEAGRAQALYEPVDLPRFTAELASVFRSAIDRAGLTLTLDLDALPEDIFVDREMWEKIVLNLLSNAFKFTLAGGITLRMRWADTGVCFQVADTGIGVPEDEIPRLFERFHRVQGSRGRTHEGTGIGLALVQELVHLHGGTIGVESHASAGTTFTLVLPAGAAHLPAERVGARRPALDERSGANAYVEEAKRWLPEAASSATSNSLAPSAPAGFINTTSTRGARILLADDNQDMREYVAGLLRQHWLVEVAADGLEALDKMQQIRPDLVLTDVMMPGLDGFGLLAKIRETPAIAMTPVLLLSARAGEDARDEGFGAGADDYLIKPFSARELVTRVHAAIAINRSRQAGRQEAEQLARAAEAANITKSQFLANMSHEIRTPLGVILGFADLALDPGQSPEEAHNYLLAIKRNGMQLLEILGDILDLSKIEANKLEIERVSFSLPDLLDDVAASLGIRARERGIGLRFERDEALPAFIRTDPTRLRQIFVNLVGNAIKFTERGEVVITCEALPASPDSATRRLSFTVKDTGIGISTEQSAKLFQPFTQADSSMTRKFGGTGLGLLLSRQLAVALDGALTLVRSEPGKGSWFRFTITVEAAESALPERERRRSDPPPVAATALEGNAPLAGIRILLVEDSEDNQILVSRYLRSSGARVELASNGLEAVEKALEGDHDVILMDIQMPVLDGHEATARLRKAGYARPIIALTAHALREERERALKGGFDNYLTKPLQRGSLIKTLRALMK
jgi:signal transduction histidine kinase